MKKILITGIEGFVGTYLAEYLNSLKYKIFGIYFAQPRKIIGKLYKCDIREYSSLLKIIKRVMPDGIFHLAAQSSVSQGEKNLIDTFLINVQGTLNLLEAVRESHIKPRIVHISSCEVYGGSNKKLIEQSATNPISFYALTKLYTEMICQYYVKYYNFDIVILRPFSHTGAGQGEQFIFPRVARRIAEIEKGLAKPYLKIGNIDVRRDYTDVADIVNAYCFAFKKCHTGEIYNITSSKPYSIRSGIEYLLNLSTKKIKIKIDKKLVRTNDISLLTGSAEKFIKVTRWIPKINFFTTLENLLDYYRTKIK